MTTIDINTRPQVTPSTLITSQDNLNTEKLFYPVTNYTYKGRDNLLYEHTRGGTHPNVNNYQFNPNRYNIDKYCTSCGHYTRDLQKILPSIHNGNTIELFLRGPLFNNNDNTQEILLQTNSKNGDKPIKTIFINKNPYVHKNNWIRIYSRMKFK